MIEERTRAYVQGVALYATSACDVPSYNPAGDVTCAQFTLEKRENDFQQSEGRHVNNIRLGKEGYTFLVHSKPFIPTTVPENEEPVRRMAVASIKKKKSRKAPKAVSNGCRLCPVWASLPVRPRSTRPATASCLAASSVQSVAIGLLHRRTSAVANPTQCPDRKEYQEVCER